MANYLKKLLGNDFNEELSIEEIGKLLEEKDVVSDSRYKSSLDKARSEIAALKKEQRKALSEEEKSKLETQELIEQLTESNNELKKQNKINEFTNKFLAKGYDKDLAGKAALATFEGDLDVALECQDTYLKGVEEKMKKDILGSTTPPGVSEGEPNTVQAINNQVIDSINNGDMLSALSAMERLENQK